MLPTAATALSAAQLAHMFENGAILSSRDVPLRLDFLNFLSCSKTASLFIVFFIKFEFLAQSAGGPVWPGHPLKSLIYPSCHYNDLHWHPHVIQ